MEIIVDAYHEHEQDGVAHLLGGDNGISLRSSLYRRAGGVAAG
jgi:hypothetical protein